MNTPNGAPGAAEPREFSLRVAPRVPEALERLTELAGDLWFAWHLPARLLFASLDRGLWRRVGRSPKRFLQSVDQSVLDEASRDESFLAHYRQVLEEYDAYRARPLDGYTPAGLEASDTIAYFCAEYGIHESFPNYSGGLGILAGDHCKASSDLGMPLTAVGLLYRRGYFRQTIDHLGQQVAHYHDYQAGDLPVMPALDPRGEPVEIDCDLPGRKVGARVWRARVGRVALHLLDTNLERNAPEDREITHTLYGGDSEMRVQQELVLGVGGVRALRALGVEPRVWHINEGHAAFSILERLRELVAGGLAFGTALEAVAANTVFTTHTPVAAGHDVFGAELIGPYLDVFAESLGVEREAVAELGASADAADSFNMTRLALSGARFVNGVSAVHERVSRELCAGAWPEVPPSENPVTHVTNGVHAATYLAEDWQYLLDEHLSKEWRTDVGEYARFADIRDIPDQVFWEARLACKRRMLEVVRERLLRQHERNHASEAHLGRLLRFVDPHRPDVLIIGFARRFATYKRATLIFRDLDWLRELVCDDERPVVLVFAGKAHPADQPGQAYIEEIHRVGNMPEFIGRVLLVENYDMSLAGPLVAGVDVWLNTPIFPLEASGTSGMKAAMNGVPNLSVLDGWWAEGYDGRNGWAIPPQRETGDGERRDAEDARTLYELLQDQVIPLYYSRDEERGYSPAWVEKSKHAMSSALPRFNMQRMLHQYACELYAPALEQGARLAADDHAAAAALSEWKARVRAAWPGVALSAPVPAREELCRGEGCAVEVKAKLNGLRPEDVRVECVFTRNGNDVLEPVPIVSPPDDGNAARHIETFTAQEETDGEWRYRLELELPWSGDLRYSIRVVPAHPLLTHPYEVGLMRWLE